jgi:hypothetical protein
MKTIVSALIGHLHLTLGLLLLVATTNWASAAEETDTNQPKPCGGYYACIELQPSLPDTVFVPWSARP